MWVLIIAYILWASLAQAGTIADLRHAAEVQPSVVPEPTDGKGCPVPPIPKEERFLEGEGWSMHHLIAFRNFDLNGMRYYIEYQILRRNEDGSVNTRPFPTTYMVDLNRNGQFDIPGEVWQDAKGDGRCADLIPLQPPAEGEPKKPLA